MLLAFYYSFFVSLPNLVNSWTVDFSKRHDVRQYFTEDEVLLTTDKSYTCTRRDHIFYRQIDFSPEPTRVMKIVLDQRGADCSSKTNISSGHLTGVEYLGFGDFEIVARTAHAPAGGRKIPPHLFTCFSAINRNRKKNWNEIALCWSSSESNYIRLSYWYGLDNNTMHQTKVHLGFDSSSSFHTYRFQYRNDSISLLVDGKSQAKIDGVSGVDLPWEEMSMRIILRQTKNSDESDIQSPVIFSVKNVTYDPLHPKKERQGNLLWEYICVWFTKDPTKFMFVSFFFSMAMFICICSCMQHCFGLKLHDIPEKQEFADINLLISPQNVHFLNTGVQSPSEVESCIDPS